MFGGGGVYHDGLMFGLIAGDTLFLKADDTTRADFEAENMKPFTYSAKGKPVAMSYWELPEELYDDPGRFVEWARRAFDVALKAKRK